jgi:hypothetical protein
MGMKKATGKETLQVALINNVMQLGGKVGDHDRSDLAFLVWSKFWFL